MAFPVVEATVTSLEDVDVTSHTVSLPSGIVSGDLLIVGFVTWVDEPPTFPAGWTSIFTGVIKAGNTRGSVYYRQADGTEGSSITVTTVGADNSGHIAYRISGHEDPATQAPEIATDNNGGSSTTTPNPPSLTPTGGAEDFLWLAIVLNRRNEPTAYPTSYVNTFSARASQGPNGSLNTSGSERQLNATSEDPSAFTISANRYAIAATIAVHPGGAGAIPLVVQDASHGLTSEGPTLVQHHVLIANEAAHAQAAEVASLTQVHNLVVQEAAHAHIADQAALLQTYTLAVDDAAHSHSSEAPALSQVHALAADEAAHPHSADGPSLVQHHVLVVQDASHGHAGETPTLNASTLLVAQDSSHVHKAAGGAFDPGFDSGYDLALTIVQHHILVINDGAHSQSADAPSLLQAHNITVSDALHSLSSDNATLSTAGALVVQGAAHSQSSESPNLIQHHVIVIQGAAHSHTADLVLLIGATPQADVDFLCVVSSQAVSEYSILIDDNASAIYAIVVSDRPVVEYRIELMDK